jgi:23S rRNA (adenine2503-C2)-methyltransferase
LTPLTDFFPEGIVRELDLKPFQGRQLFKWIHQKQVFDFAEMTDLSKDLRKRLSEHCLLPQIQPVDQQRSDAEVVTGKLLFRLADGETVEAVRIGDDDGRVTFCLSSQVGCAVRCAFCATGMSGFQRHLSAGEIAEQALHLIRRENMGEKSPNIVYMGMGEPLRNYDNVVKSIRLLMRKDGLNIGARRITVSTVGDASGIRRFAEENWQVRLSISLHAANDELRSQLVPLNRKFGLAKLMDAVREYIAASGRQVTFEWALLDGVNDRFQDARELAELVKPLKAAVNLIPYNPVPGAPYATPSRNRCMAFQKALEEQGVKATLRKERGQDIDAACGQLRRRTEAGETVSGSPVQPA